MGRLGIVMGVRVRVKVVGGMRGFFGKGRGI